MSKHNYPKKRRVHFRLNAPNAREVKLILFVEGDSLKVGPMDQKMNGEWRKIAVLSPGRYRYRYVVDGRIMNDPKNRRLVSDGCGNHYNELLVYFPWTREL